MAEMQAEACNWPQAVQLRLTALGMPPLSRVGIAGILLPCSSHSSFSIEIASCAICKRALASFHTHDVVSVFSGYAQVAVQAMPVN